MNYESKKTKDIHSGAFKAKVAIEALQERETLAELSKKYGIHPNQITRWKKEFLERAPQLFEKPQPTDDHEKEMGKMFAKIGQLEMEREFLNLKGQLQQRTSYDSYCLQEFIPGRIPDTPQIQYILSV